MAAERIDVIATSISGSIRDWGKVERIVPLFAREGLETARLEVADSHAEARRLACEAVRAGGRTLISAGGSGTFNSVLEGCCDAGVPLEEIRLGFLRKGSADLIGKVLGMPDEIESAIRTFAASIRADRCVPCDVLQADAGAGPPRHFVGYGGAGIFGRIPHFTENRFMKWYKGVLSQVFGDLGPFTTGMALALGEMLLLRPFTGRRRWSLRVDGGPLTEGCFHTLILVNGYLGPELPFSEDPLGSGRFHLFALEDRGLLRLPGQVRSARSGAITAAPERWGLRRFTATGSLELRPQPARAFPVNVDGSTLQCPFRVVISISGSIRLISGA